ncbi:MAG: 1,4-alpha-glucan branching protein GlgB [Actinobacteria bacterium]|nr:1,4-alpha-glucan branching protein GlgB [Actinomycetota bacterium]
MKEHADKNIPVISHLTEYDIYLFKNGSHYRLYEKMGAHSGNIYEHDKKINKKGVYFSVWAPNARSVSVVGDFNYWNIYSNPMGPRWDESGIWEVFVPNAEAGMMYKFHIKSSVGNFEMDKLDPFSFYSETPPKTASVVWNTDYNWKDSSWMDKRHIYNSLESPFSIYELHIGSWKRIAMQNNRSLTYREMAEHLSDYIKENGFTHVEFMPVMEHPFYGSWGYQTTCYFAPTSRFGTPQDFMYLVDCLHNNDIGVILDWVPSHFPNDLHALALFDGTELYEHKDPKKGFHPDWKSLIFNYGRREVKEFLISSALFWLDKYHIDGLRIDAVASMLYLDYSRKEGEWIPNKFGGRENLEAIDFLKELNTVIYKNYPDVQTFAEESTAWPAVTKPVHMGGLGFGMKWNMGWMHDSLQYFQRDPVYRKYHQSELTFAFWYAFFENFILPLSHDEVVYGKKSLLDKMPGDNWQKFANLRLLFAYMFGFPGKKLLFMGAETAQQKEWHHEDSIDWSLARDFFHAGISKLIKDLNRIYKNEEALHENDFEPGGFEWIDYGDDSQSTIFFIRKSSVKKNPANKNTAAGKQSSILVACNFTPAPRHGYRIGVPNEGIWEEILNSDAEVYGGSGQGNFGRVKTEKIHSHARPYSLSITLPPLAAVFLKNSENPGS